jgi:hypothetical protein
MRLRLLQESIDRTPAIPTLKNELPSDEVFYDSEVSEWTDAESVSSS